ncbi:MAG: sugar ABC transporter ATP-binding protein [Spirochaetia bacterium]|jgi:simple sugar transport system ATP-binding protein
MAKESALPVEPRVEVGKGRSTLEMQDISISFPGVKALRSVGFRTETGVSHALVGANGAGKSTLMKVLAGAYAHYTGRILMDGAEVRIRSPREAKSLGIEVVYQEVDTALVPILSVGENIMLDLMVNDMGARQVVKWRRLHEQARRILEELRVDLDTRLPVSRFSLAEKQMVLIARALSKECRFLILDEPTAPLSTSETGELFRVIRDILTKNIGVIFISHRLPEVMEVCQRVTVLRDGERVDERSVQEVDVAGIVEMMLGRRFEENFPKHRVPIGDIVFSVKGLDDQSKVRDVDLYVRAGEIVGIAGLVGAGKSELCKALFGASPVRCREALIQGRPYRFRDPHGAVLQGVGLVPEERRREGILVEESVATNLTAASLSRFSGALGFLRFGAERKEVRTMIGKLEIRTPNENQKVGFLSGGNQQKVSVGKWLIANAEVYLFDEPTKGVDVGAKRDIFELIGRLAESGKAIIYASCELAEILGITDRIYVLYDGRICREIQTAQATEEELLFYATGGT